ncbi:hypothetical protein A7X67_04025 [Clostridium sp. W14A]|nr:hypothetical protein A7X67_04025 [Clostridium sp. W14A]
MIILIQVITKSYKICLDYKLKYDKKQPFLSFFSSLLPGRKYAAILGKLDSRMQKGSLLSETAFLMDQENKLL